jgi:peptide/nickel transport system ATP-binding protein
MSIVKPGERDLLSVHGLSKHYTQSRPFSQTKFTVRAFDNVSLSVRRGATLALVGESGAGKSSLARCMALLETPSSGDISFAGVDLLDLGKNELFPFRRQIQMVFQDPTSALNPRLTAEDIIAEPLIVQREGSRAEQREKVLRLMEQVGLAAGSECKRPLEFSGGQRQRLAIARALALEPRLLIFDEALSHLDVLNQDLLLELLSELQKSLSLTYVHVCHDLSLVARFADDVAVMQEGRIVEQKSARELFARPTHPHTQDFLASPDANRFARSGR